MTHTWGVLDQSGDTRLEDRDSSLEFIDRHKKRLDVLFDELLDIGVRIQVLLKDMDIDIDPSRFRFIGHLDPHSSVAGCSEATGGAGYTGPVPPVRSIGDLLQELREACGGDCIVTVTYGGAS